jgi:hypothetical protein
VVGIAASTQSIFVAILSCFNNAKLGFFDVGMLLLGLSSVILVIIGTTQEDSAVK